MIFTSTLCSRHQTKTLRLRGRTHLRHHTRMIDLTLPKTHFEDELASKASTRRVSVKIGNPLHICRYYYLPLLHRVDGVGHSKSHHPRTPQHTFAENPPPAGMRLGANRTGARQCTRRPQKSYSSPTLPFHLTHGTLDFTRYAKVARFIAR
jgi:hypothetical protein